MANQHLLQRLLGVKGQLVAAHAAGKSLSSSSKGRERETFINNFLKAVFPPTFRFGSGDATDVAGNRSGQLDVVIEFPFAPSLPALGSSDVRLYLAESIAAVIEVKSDIANQWHEVEETSYMLKPIARSFGTTLSMGRPPSPKIPVIGVGFEGWKTAETVQQKLHDSPVAAVFIVEPGIFVTSPSYGGWRITGPDFALWAVISFLHSEITKLQAAYVDPLNYLR